MDTIITTIQPGHSLALPKELWDVLPEGQAVQLRWDERGNLIVTSLDADDLAELPGLKRMAEEALAEEDEVLPFDEAMAEIDHRRNRTMA